MMYALLESVIRYILECLSLNLLLHISFSLSIFVQSLGRLAYQ